MKIASAAHALTTGLIVASFAWVASSRLYSEECKQPREARLRPERQEPGRAAKATRVALHDAIPFDAPRIQSIQLNHRGSRYSFEAILEDYAVADPALQTLALIVRAADVKGQESAAPEGIGLRSIAQGFAALGISDEERLVRQFPVYDALYAYVQSRR